MSTANARPILLVVEDELAIVQLITALTGSLEVQLVAAANGRQALSMLEHMRPALVTVDLVLPDLDGFEVLEQVRRNADLVETPVVVISALSDPQSIKRAYAAGASDFLAKPFNVGILEAKLRMFLRTVWLTEQVKEREAFLEDVMEHLSSGLLVCDRDFRIRKLNPAGAAQLSLPDAQTAIGRPLSEVAPGAEAMCETSNGTPQRRVTVQMSSGPRPFGYSNSRLGDGSVVIVFRGLSEAEVARREAEERARHEALARAASSFAHEVRNPLAAIAAAAQIAGRDDVATPMRKRMSRAIESEALRVAGLVREYVERQAPPPPSGDVDLAAMLDEVVEVNLLDSPARGRISVECAPGLPTVRADAARLKQVVLNLVLNAASATDAGGTISLRAITDGLGVKLTVHDSGHGIAAADLPHIFEERFTTREGGKGLGLPISQRIVEEHGGTLRVHSAPGQGTAFTVWLRTI